MKQMLKTRTLILLTGATLLVILFSNCNRKNTGNNYPEGFKGTLTDPRAMHLDSVCHFIPKELINEWTARYKRSSGDSRYKNIAQDSAGQVPAAMDFLKAGTVSFNSCIIRKLINDKSSIGLRVLLGLDEKNVVHVIFVGVDKDYGNLYVEESADCCKGNATAMLKSGLSRDGVMGVTARTGGAEYGQIP